MNCSLSPLAHLLSWRFRFLGGYLFFVILYISDVQLAKTVSPALRVSSLWWQSPVLRSNFLISDNSTCQLWELLPLLEKSLPMLVPWSDLSVFSFISCKVSCLTLRPLICFELIFVQGERWGRGFISLYVDTGFLPSSTPGRACLFPMCIFWQRCQKLSAYSSVGLFCGLYSSLLICRAALCLCCVSVATALYWNLKLGIVTLLT